MKMFAIIMIGLTLGAILLALIFDDGEWALCLAFVCGMITLFAGLGLILYPLSVQSNINRYEKEKQTYTMIVESDKYKNMSDLDKVNVLSPLLDLDNSIRSAKKSNKKWLWDWYIPDSIEKVELLEK